MKLQEDHSGMRHFFVFLIYVAAAALMAIAGPEWAEISKEKAAFLGLFILLLCGLAHENIVRRQENQLMETGFEALSTVISELNQDIRKLNEQIETQQELVDKLTTKEAFESVRTEVDMLQTLVSQLSGGKGKPAVVKKTAKVADVPKEKGALLELVREGLQQDRVDLYLQPIVNLPQRKVKCYECFSRIRNKKGELLMPASYIEIAENEGLIAVIDNMLLFRCIQLVRLALQKASDKLFFINLSPYTLKDAHFFGDFIDFLVENPVLSKHLVFEVDQKLFDDGQKKVEELLEKLIKAGCRLCLQGVTTLSFDHKRLNKFQVEFIKVDQSVLKPYLETKAKTSDLAKIKLNLDRHDIDIIAEKIEEEKQVAEVLDYDMDYGQGYLFGEPVLYDKG